MIVTVTRQVFTSNSTIGSLFINGAFMCFTLEDEDKLAKGVPKAFGTTAIPMGEYDLQVTRSNRFSAIAKKDVYLPLLVNVPGFEGVRIHSGNDSTHTEGCVLLGMVRNADTIGMSRIAMQKFMDAICIYDNGIPKLKEKTTIEILRQNDIA